MTNKHYKGNEMIRRLVIGADFVILNIVLLFYTQYGQELIPAYFDKATKITFFVANAALFLGEYFYSTIIHVRKIGFLQVTKRTLYLLQQQHSVFYLLKTTRSRGKDVLLQHYLRHNILSVSHHKPTLRAQITKVFPL